MEMVKQVDSQQARTLQKNSEEAQKKKLLLIFGTLTSAFGHKFKSLYSSEDELNMAQAVWIDSIGFLTDDEIHHALEKVKYSAEWSPGISEFVKAALDLPSLDQVVARVLGDSCNDPVSERIRKQIGLWDLGRQPQQLIRTRIYGLYDDTYNDYIEGLKNERRQA